MEFTLQRLLFTTPVRGNTIVPLPAINQLQLFRFFSWVSPSGSCCPPSWFPTWRTWTSWPGTSATCSTSRPAWPPSSSSWSSSVRRLTVFYFFEEVLHGRMKTFQCLCCPGWMSTCQHAALEMFVKKCLLVSVMVMEKLELNVIVEEVNFDSQNKVCPPNCMTPKHCTQLTVDPFLILTF